MTTCDVCGKDIITFSSSMWEQTGIEIPSKEQDGKIIKLCWECYDKYKENNKE